MQPKDLLSAYIDGELHGEERALAERMLAEQTDALQLVQQWREQGNALRSLPKFQLKNDLSETVLERINEKMGLVGGGAPMARSMTRMVGAAVSLDPKSSIAEEQTPSLKPESSKFLWGLGLGALSSLAAMLLLTLFVFPRGQGLEVVNQGSGSGIEDQARLFSPLPRDSGERAQGGEGSVSEGSDVARADAVEGSTGLSALKVEADKNAIRNNELAASATASDLKETLEAAIELDPELPLEAVGVPAPVSIEQIFFVNFRTDDQPLAVVSEIFSRNQIEILNGGVSTDQAGQQLAGENAEHRWQKKESEAGVAGAGRSNLDTMNELYEQSSDGMEALFVVATRSQLNRAMNELADRAEVSGYQVTARLISDMIAQQWKALSSAEANDPTMDEIIARLNAQRMAKFKTMPPFPRAMAQQIRPFGSSHGQKMSLPNQEGQPNHYGALGQPYAKTLQSQQFVPSPGNFKSAPPVQEGADQRADLPSRPPVEESREGRIENRAEDGHEDDELVHFLLFVRSEK